MQLKLHRVIEGPLQDPETGEWTNIYLAEFEDGTVEPLEMEHNTMDDCYKAIRHLATRIEPIVLDMEGEYCLTSNQN
jgi:hypothetical protein